jgi:phosphoesterase RecJ-like protein
MINYARRIQDVKVAALIQEQRNGRPKSDNQRHFHVSLRSDGSVDVAAIAGAFGGGGHASAAGFQVESSLLKLKSDIKTLAQNL